MRLDTHPLAPDLEHVLAHTEDIWPRLRSARLFISGGTGFFGTWLLETLAWAEKRHKLGLRATVLSRDPAAFALSNPRLAGERVFEWTAGDVRDFSFPPGRHSHVIHAATAASARMTLEEPLAMFDTIVTGTRRVLEFASSSGASEFLLTSSGAVYGPQPPSLARIPEDYLGGPNINDPASAYATGKRAAEQLCALYHREHGIAPRIARCFAFVGPYQPLDAHFAVGNFLDAALAGRDIVVHGDGRPMRSYLHAADLLIWLLTILTQGAENRPYNVGDDEAIDIKGLAELVSACAGGVSRVIVRTPPPVNDAPPPRYVPDVTRAGTELGLARRIPLPNALDRTLRWLRRH